MIISSGLNIGKQLVEEVGMRRIRLYSLAGVIPPSSVPKVYVKNNQVYELHLTCKYHFPLIFKI